MNIQEPVTLTDILDIMQRAISTVAPEDEKNIDAIVQKLNTLFANEILNDIICSQIIILLTLASSWKTSLRQHDNPSNNIPPYLQG